jgi:hypothetical protein
MRRSLHRSQGIQNTWLDIRRRATALMLMMSRLNYAELLHTYVSLISSFFRVFPVLTPTHAKSSL